MVSVENGGSPISCGLRNGCRIRNLNCGAATHRGEQRERNDQSVTASLSDEDRVNSIRSVHRTSLTCHGEVRRVAARSQAKAVNQPGGIAGKRHRTPVCAWMIGDRMVGTTHTVIRENCLRRSRHGRRQTVVRVSVVAAKRVTFVEPRDTGKKRCNDRKRAKSTAGSACKG